MDRSLGGHLPNHTVGQAGTMTSDELFETYVVAELDVILRVAKSLTQNQQDAEDLVQETMIRAYRSIDRFDGSYPRSWLMTIMRNAEINRHRKRRPRLLTTAEIESPEQPVEVGSSVEDETLASNFETAVAEALIQLAPAFRTAVELIDLDGLSYSEASAVSGVAEGTLMSRTHRGRKKLRAVLAKAGYEPRSNP